MTPEQFITVARSYIDTPFRHQGRRPGIAIDCAGVVVCAAQECGSPISDRHGYSDIPDGVEFKRCVLENCDEINRADVRAGDLMTFAWTRYEQHVAIVSQLNPIMIIHALADAERVIETVLDEYWLRRLRGCFRLKVMQWQA